MAISLVRFRVRAALNLERAAILSAGSAQSHVKVLYGDEAVDDPLARLNDYDDNIVMLKSRKRTTQIIHTQPTCNGSVCSLQKDLPREDLMERTSSAIRKYSKHHGKPEDRRKRQSDSDSDSDSDTECKGLDRSEFWRRKMRTVHNILDVNKDGLISYNDFELFSQRFIALGHLDQHQAKEFSDTIKMTWEEQWGAIDPYNYVTVEQYLEDMNHVLNDKALKKKAHRWLPYLFKAVDKDNSGFISVKEFKLFYECLGLDNEHAAVAFAVIDNNGDGKVSLKEFVKLGKDFFFTEDETRASRMFWGPLTEEH